MMIFHNHITKNKERSLHKNMVYESCKKNCTSIWRNLTIDEIIPQIGSSQKAHAIHEILKKLDSNDKKFNLPNFKKTYDLAHCESQKLDGVEVLKTRKGNITFSTEKFKQIRKNIIHYHDAFCKILKDIQK